MRETLSLEDVCLLNTMNEPKPVMTGPIFHKLSLTLVFVKIIDQGLLEHISGHMEEKTMIRDSQYGFAKGQ